MTAFDANEAPTILSPEWFDLLIKGTFIHAPDGTIIEGGGILLLGKMRTLIAKADRPKSIAVTGHVPTQFSGVDLLVLAQTLGADQVMHNPFRPQDLIAQVSVLLENPLDGS